MSTELVPMTQIKGELAAEAQQTSQAMALLKTFEVRTPEDLEFAGGLVHSVKDRWKALEEKRTSVTKPINAALRAVNDLFRPVQEPLKQAEAIIKQKIAAYTLAQRAAQEEAMRAAAAAMQAGNAAQAAEHVAALAPAPTAAGVGVREVWTFEIVDEAAVPRELCSPDAAKIGAHIPASTSAPAPQIPGIRFFLRGSVTVR